MKFKVKSLKKLLIKTVPYVAIGLIATNLGEAWRLAGGDAPDEKIAGMFTGGAFSYAFSNIAPSFHPFDLLIGAIAGGALWLAVYLKGKKKKKYRHNEEYGSARWGGEKDIEPYLDPDKKKNIILSKTEGLMMSGRPSNPKYARNKNVLVVGGSGSGKTRFFIKPNLLQMHSSYVVTDPNGKVFIR